MPHGTFQKDRVDLLGAPVFTEGLFGSISLVTWVRSSRSLAASCSSPEVGTLSHTPRPRCKLQYRSQQVGARSEINQSAVKALCGFKRRHCQKTHLAWYNSSD